MDIQKYIESGILEEYCLGLLNERDGAFLIRMATFYPEIRAELTAAELTFENLSAVAALEPAPHNRQNILAALGFADDTSLDINNLPAVDENADYQEWLNTFAHLIPALPNEDFLIHEVRKDDRYQQMLVVTKMDVPEEEHGDYLESFFILKGRCECTVDNKLHQLGAGDFLQIPLHVKHNIQVLSPYVVAILQYEFV